MLAALLLGVVAFAVLGLSARRSADTAVATKAEAQVFHVCVHALSYAQGRRSRPPCARAIADLDKSPRRRPSSGRTLALVSPAYSPARAHCGVAAFSSCSAAAT